ncbi:MAG TPA: tetratricopeptide repeat protein [Terriglobales bacterium]|nr:tetratricopeptide repeat protein [Terriglobales bacterium]
MKTRFALVALLLAASSFSIAQNPQVQKPGSVPETAAPAKKASAPASEVSKAAAPRNEAVKPDRAQAYYHYSMAHIYEELVTSYARSEFAGKAIDEYKLALEYDPNSPYLNAGLAELYAKTGQIKEAVLEAQDIIKRDPSNVEARRLLGRIYLRSLGDMQQGPQSQEMLKLAIEQFQQIVALDPASVEDHLLLGRLYRINNDLLRAEGEFKIAVKLQPDSEEAITSLAYLYGEEGDSKRAVQTLESVPDAERSARLYGVLGYTYEQAKDYKKAIDAYRRSVDLDHDNLDSIRGLAQNLLNDGQTDGALEQFKTVAESDPQDPQAALRIAEIYRQQGKFDEALDSLKKAQALVQDSLEIPYNMALVYEAQGRYDDAVSLLQGLLKRSEKTDGNYTASEKNNRGVFLERLGSVYREQNKDQLAIATYRQLIALGGDQSERGYEQIVETYRAAKQWGQALSTAQEAAQKLPDSREMKMNLAQQLADNDQGPAAVAQVKALLQNKPSDREVYLTLAQIETSLKQFKDAEDSAAQAEKLSAKPEEKSYATFVAGSVYEREKKYDLAEQKFKAVLADDARNAPVLNYLGYMLADRGLRLEEALGYIKKAVAQEPENGAYLDSLGWVYYKMGNYDLAEANLLKAIDKMGNDGTVQDHLADLYFKTGRLRQAAAHWERALDEWNKTSKTQVDASDVARVQKQLESARVKLAKEETQK